MTDPNDKPITPGWGEEPLTPEEEARLREQAEDMALKLRQFCRNEEELRYAVEFIRERIELRFKN